MSTDIIIDQNHIRSTYRWTSNKSMIAEARALDPARLNPAMIGFFDNEDAFTAACIEANRAGRNLYVGLNPRPESALARSANKLSRGISATRSEDITVVHGTYIDIDPDRRKDTPSTDAELGLALEVAEEICLGLEHDGFLRPIRIMSGNGVQLLFAVAPIELDVARRTLVAANLKRFENEVRRRYGANGIRIDSTHDVPRVMKLAGTKSWKGAESPDRPHRMSAPLDPLVRGDDPCLREYLLTPSPAPQRRALPVVPSRTTLRQQAGPVTSTALPFRPCSPLQRLLDHGLDDRSQALWHLVLWFVHQGLEDNDIVARLLQWDGHHGQKLVNRGDREQYIFKAIAAARDSAHTSPPCGSMRSIGLCPVDDVSIRCELQHPVVDIESAIRAIDPSLPGVELEYRLLPVFDGIAEKLGPDRQKLLELVSRRFNLSQDALGVALDRAGRRLTQLPAVRVRSKGAPGIAPSIASLDEGMLGAPRTPASLRALQRSPMKGDVEVSACQYLPAFEKSPLPISSFILRPIRRVQLGADTVIVCDAHLDQGYVISNLRIPRKAFNNRRTFLEHLRSDRLQFTGDDNHLQGILRHLAEADVPESQGTSSIGVQETKDGWACVFEGGAIDATGFRSPPPMEYVPPLDYRQRKIIFEDVDDDSFRAVASTVFAELPRLNTPEVMVPVVGWAFAACIKPIVQRRLKAFPILSITGTGGSGKTSLATRVLLPLSGSVDSDAENASKTKFTLVRSLASTTSVPILLDEFKPSEMSRKTLEGLYNLIKQSYMGAAEDRGSSDLSVTGYRLTAPIILAGEDRPEDSPLLERFVAVSPRRDSVHQPAYRRALASLTREPLHLFTPRYLKFVLGRDLRDDFEEARRRVDQALGDRVLANRIRVNLEAMTIGLVLFERFAEFLDLPLGAELPLKAGINAVLRDLVGDDESPRNALDRMIAALPSLIHPDGLQESADFALTEKGLWIRIDSMLKAYRTHLADLGEHGFLVGPAAISRMADEEMAAGGYVIDTGHRIVVRDGRRRGLLIDLMRAEHLVSAEELKTRPMSPLPSMVSGATDLRALRAA